MLEYNFSDLISQLTFLFIPIMLTIPFFLVKTFKMR